MVGRAVPLVRSHIEKRRVSQAVYIQLASSSKLKQDSENSHDDLPPELELVSIFTLAICELRKK